jgi:hypothetical protein
VLNYVLIRQVKMTLDADSCRLTGNSEVMLSTQTVRPSAVLRLRA